MQIQIRFTDDRSVRTMVARFGLRPVQIHLFHTFKPGFREPKTATERSAKNKK